MYNWNESFNTKIIASSSPSSSPCWRVNTVSHHIVLLFFIEPFGLLEFLHVGPFLLFTHIIISLCSDSHNVGSPHVRVLFLYLHALARHEDIVSISGLLRHVWHFVLIILLTLHLLRNLLGLTLCPFGDHWMHIYACWNGTDSILLVQISAKV